MAVYNYLKVLSDGSQVATRYEPQVKDYNGFGDYFDGKQWYSDVAVFSDDFSTDTTGSYTLSNVTADYVNNKVKITNTATSTCYIQKQITTEVGKRYKVTFDCTRIDHTYIIAYAYTSTHGILSRFDSYDAGTVKGEFEFISTQEIISIRFGGYGASGKYGYYDNIAIIPLNDDGSIDTSNATPLVTAPTYLPYKALVDEQGNVLDIDKFDVPTLVDEYIRANKLSTDTLFLKETQWLNEDGIEYADSGIQGVPDTSFSSTGARIYPDGTIRGKSSYGEYVKYPDGVAICLISLSLNLTITQSNLFGSTSGTIYSGIGTHLFPSEFSETPKMSGNCTNSSNAGYAKARNVNSTGFTSSIVNIASGEVGATYIAIGRWK